MTITVNIHEAKTHLSKLLERVVRGEEVIIAKAGKPLAILSRAPSVPAPLTPGDDAGSVTIGPDFKEPLPEFE